MATIHRTTMVPSKAELLAGWLPQQPWYRDTGRPPVLNRAGGFRLDDPDGAVGIEFIFINDGTGADERTYHVPVTYRGAALPEAESGLLGTSEHGVLGRRWIYDAAHDPVAVAQLLAFLCGATEAQHQNDSDTPDPSVGRHWTPAGRLIAPTPLLVSNSEPEGTTVAVDLAGPAVEPGRHLLDLIRVLRPGGSSGAAPTRLGVVEADWQRLDGSTARGPVAVLL